MKKIGVCACYNSKNYGSMLQTLATEKQLEKLGFSYEIIRYSRKLTPALLFRSIDRIPEILKKKLEKKKQAIELTRYPKVKYGIKIRNQCFDSFMTSTFTALSPIYDTFRELQNAAKKYDAVLVGSDQLWRPEGFSTGFYTLEFVPDDVIKISYATSFGVSQIPKNKLKIAKKFLERINHISVRELRASKMVEEITGRKVPTVVDPTLLFNEDEWKVMIPEKKVIDTGKKYIFCYLLGANPAHRSAVKKFSAETGCIIVTTPHLDEFVEADDTFGDISMYQVGPAEFVNLIRNASYVCTDSFHGSVFSILHHKSFVTFNRFADGCRNSRNSRIDSLLHQTGLESRHCTDLTALSRIMDEKIDYIEVEKKLTRMREDSQQYLKNALDSI